MLLGVVLILIQFLAAIPWMLAVTWQPAPPPGSLKQASTAPLPRWNPFVLLAKGLLGAVVLGLGFGFFIENLAGPELLEGLIGRVYASALQLQLYADLLVLVLFVAFWVWPKGAAVARASFRESYRQPLFWLLVGLASVLLLLSPFVPYFTFGEDFIMVKELGFDTIMLAASAFGVLAAAMSITEEIEGRTAITLMSKPVSRRQFLLGKFLGIFLCCLMMVLVLGWLFDWVLLYKRFFDRMDPVPLSPALAGWVEGLPFSAAGRSLMRGMTLWGRDTSEVVPGLFMAASLVMVLVAVSVTLATRLPLIVNLVLCLVVYLLANLMPVLVLSTQPKEGSPGGPVQKLLHFTAQLFDTLLPGLDLFRVRPTLIGEENLPLGDYVRHSASVGLYGILFTAIVLLLGLVLFEDRDLA